MAGLEALLYSTALVAAAEIGDKTQLLSFLLAARFPNAARSIIAGIAVATLANHALASSFGAVLAARMPAQWLRIGLAACFFAFALWALVPDQPGAAPGADTPRAGVFLVTVLAFFAAEMGDKTQLATIGLAAKYHSILLVTLGTTLGMLVANVPAVLVGERLTRVLPLKFFRIIAAILFAAFGVAILLSDSSHLP